VKPTLAHRLRVTGGPRAGETFDLDRPCIVGRGNEATLRILEDPFMSRSHARLERGLDGAWSVRNISQGRPLVVGGQPVTGERMLKPGDVILIGRTLLIFELADPTSRRPQAFPPTNAGGASLFPTATAVANAPVAPTAIAPRGFDVPIPHTRIQPPAPAPAPAPEPAPTTAPTADPDSMKMAAVVFLPGDSLELSSADLAKYELFKGIPEKTIEGSVIKRHKINDQPPIWLRTFEPGELICREGEYGSTAFFIAEGTVTIGIDAPRPRRSSKKPVGLLWRLLGRGDEPEDEEEAEEGDLVSDDSRLIPVDGHLLPYDKPIGELRAGDIFGEMSCMSFYPRSATCVAGPQGAKCLEMLRSVLDFIRSNAKASYKERIEKNYKERSLDLALRNIPMLSSLPKARLEALRPRIELVSVAPDTPIYAEGAAADAVFLLRLGFVKLSQKRQGGELVLQYVGPGQHFGEVGLLAGAPRKATATALDNVELIRIARDDFAALCKEFPDVARAAEQGIEAASPAALGHQELPLGTLLEKGVMNAQNLLVIDLEKCTRCDECVKACADEHDGVTRLIRDGLRVDKYLVASACRACTDPVCMIGCPVGSIRRRNSLEIIIEDWCIGCGKCAQQCPYGNINMHPYEKWEKVVEEKDGKTFKRRELAIVNQGKGRAVGCDLCKSEKEPRCVYACPHGAAKRGSPAELFGSSMHHD
jgi:CRP-like cAMP-binding protein/Fe-S-cluster-containing hydrogenase component 2